MSGKPEDYFRYTISEEETLSEGVVAAVAEATDCAPLELTPSLWEVIDPDILDKLSQLPDQGRHQGDVHVEFEYVENKVIAHSYGVIKVIPSEPSLDNSADD